MWLFGGALACSEIGKLRFRDRTGGAPIIYDGSWNSRSATLYNNRFLFTGREYNSGFGFYEYRARAYSPTLGRFMSEDPKLFDAGDYNLFRYCGNDPLDHVDPMGLEIQLIAEKQNQKNDESLQQQFEQIFEQHVQRHEFADDQHAVEVRPVGCQP